MERSIKPQILSTFGDVALVLGDKFHKYLEPTKHMLQQAMYMSITQVWSLLMDGWMYGRVGRCMDGCMERWMHGWVDLRVHGGMGGCMEGGRDR